MNRSRAGMIRPPRLREGDRVALIAPAGPVTDDRVEQALDRCDRFGLRPVLGRSARNRHSGYLAGTDADRLADLHWALTSDDVDAAWALRGGYGTMRLLSRLRLEAFVERPRAYIGFSDNTALHLALRARGVVSYHGPHAGGDASGLAEDCFRRVLFEETAAGSLPMPEHTPAQPLTRGVAEGPLIGGNLALLAGLCGTPAAPSAAGAILFLEDIGEPAYRLDRAWTQLVLAGVLNGVRGVALGRFTDCGAETAELLREMTVGLGVPVLAELPIGHEDDNWTLPLGVHARLDCQAGTLELLEPAVS